MAAQISVQRLSGYGLRRALMAGIQRVIARRDEINRINVFPVPDGDTGTNLAFTLSAVLQGVRAPKLASAGEVLRRAASEAIDGARGNSGAILAQFFQGVSEAMGPSKRLTPEALARAVARGAALAREAMAEPREGTILSVIQAFAGSLREQAEHGRDFRTGFRNALAVAREALRHTPEQLAALRAAGVVDAGAMGFVDMLEGIDDYIAQGRSVLSDALPEELSAAGVDTASGVEYTEGHRFCTECMVSGEAVDRGALKAALLALPLSSLVIAGTREKVRVHAHLDEPVTLFEAASRFGVVSREKADDMRAQSKSAHSRREQVAIVADSGADIPAEAMDRLNIHLVPVRLSIGGRDFLDRVSISPREFYHELRTSPVAPRTSQPPPGDFRRLFEFLLSHHERVVDVSLAAGLSGTLQSAESAAARTDADRIAVFDSRNGSAGQGLLAIWAAEAALAGLSAPRIVEGLVRMRPRSTLYAVVRDVGYGVRGGRAPRLAGPLSRLLRFSPVVRSKPDGRIGLVGAVWGREDLPEKFARKIARRLDPARTWRIIVGHCDCAEDAERAHAALLRAVPKVDRAWIMEAGVAIGVHAGPGSLVIGVQDYEPPTP
ncbi:MAG: DegV family EDD domain-containing protein [Xanthomonadales bacterium]|nr:DegV family EDD domain-containing protein [Xanthomonadales bacterium]